MASNSLSDIKLVWGEINFSLLAPMHLSKFGRTVVPPFCSPVSAAAVQDARPLSTSSDCLLELSRWGVKNKWVTQIHNKNDYSEIATLLFLPLEEEAAHSLWHCCRRM